MRCLFAAFISVYACIHGSDTPIGLFGSVFLWGPSALLLSGCVRAAVAGALYSVGGGIAPIATPIFLHCVICYKRPFLVPAFAWKRWQMIGPWLMAASIVKEV